MTDITIRYRGNDTIESADTQRAHQIVDALLAASADESVEFDSGTVIGRDGEVEFRFIIEANTVVETTQETIDLIAQKMVDLGIEPDKASAVENVEV